MLVLAIAGFAATAQAPDFLKEAFRRDFCGRRGHECGADYRAGCAATSCIAAQFNSISPENALKWENVHPQPGKYDFALADQYVAFGQQHHMFIVGHNLVWHNQVPAWVFHDDKGNLLTRDALLARMRDHIQTVVGRYKGRIQSWDVVNEALNEDGTLRQSLWYKIIGDDYIEKAFEYAHEADPQAQLTYNDYNLENDAKRNGAIALVKKLQAKEFRLHPSDSGARQPDMADGRAGGCRDFGVCGAGREGCDLRAGYQRAARCRAQPTADVR